MSSTYCKFCNISVKGIYINCPNCGTNLLHPDEPKTPPEKYELADPLTPQGVIVTGVKLQLTKGKELEIPLRRALNMAWGDSLTVKLPGEVVVDDKYAELAANMATIIEMLTSNFMNLMEGMQPFIDVYKNLPEDVKQDIARMQLDKEAR